MRIATGGGGEGGGGGGEGEGGEGGEGGGWGGQLLLSCTPRHSKAFPKVRCVAVYGRLVADNISFDGSNLLHVRYGRLINERDQDGEEQEFPIQVFKGSLEEGETAF